MYIYTPLCRYWIALFRYVLVSVPHMDIELEDNKQFISNIPRTVKQFHNLQITACVLLSASL